MTDIVQIGDLIIEKNNQLIAFNKPVGLPVVPDKTGDKALADLAAGYCKHPVHLVHRLDRPASGVVLFAKTENALRLLNDQFKHRMVRKTYLAVVGQHPPKKEDTLLHFLTKDGRSNKSRVSDENKSGSKQAELTYRVIGSINNYHLLEIELVTGRHHQIRAQLATIGSPIKGDVKYGFRRGNRDRSIHLHAWKLTFEHPVSGEEVTLTAPPPQDSVWDAFEIHD